MPSADSAAGEAHKRLFTERSAGGVAGKQPPDGANRTFLAGTDVVKGVVVMGGPAHVRLGMPAAADLQLAGPAVVVAALAVRHRVNIVRVHNVAATRQALQIAEAIDRAQ